MFTNNIYNEAKYKRTDDTPFIAVGSNLESWFGTNIDERASTLEFAYDIPINKPMTKLINNYLFKNTNILKSFAFIAHESFDNILSTADNNIEGFIINEISQISDVEYIFIIKNKYSTEIITVVNHFNPENEDKIYDKEYKIIQRLENPPINFNVIFRHDRPIKDIYPENAVRIWRR